MNEVIFQMSDNYGQVRGETCAGIGAGSVGRVGAGEVELGKSDQRPRPRVFLGPVQRLAPAPMQHQFLGT